MTICLVFSMHFWGYTRLTEAHLRLSQRFYIQTTEDGSVNAVPQILYGQYLILEAFGSYMF